MVTKIFETKLRVNQNCGFKGMQLTNVIRCPNFRNLCVDWFTQSIDIYKYTACYVIISISQEKEAKVPHRAERS